MLRRKILILCLSAGLLPGGKIFAEDLKKLPPNWTSGRPATESGLYKEREKTKHTPVSSEADFIPDQVRFGRHFLGIVGTTPEILRADYRFRISSFLALNLGLSGPFPIKIHVEMPSDVIKANQKTGMAVAYPAFDLNFKVDWGPYIYGGMVWHPFGGNWYTAGGLGIRSIKISGSTSAPLRVCSIIEAAKEPPCGNDESAIQTRNSIALSAKISLFSYLARFTTGWVWEIADDWALMLEGGIFSPFKTRKATTVHAAIVSPDGVPENLSGALDTLRAQSEVDVANKVDNELGKYTNRPLPILGLGLSYHF